MVKKEVRTIERTQGILEGLYKKYHKPEFIAPDPLLFPRRYTKTLDIEAAAFIAASFALGRVNAIIAFLERVFKTLGSPYNGITERSEDELKDLFSDFRYRFYSPADIAALMIGLRGIYHKYGSIEACFNDGLKARAEQNCPEGDRVVRGLLNIAGEINTETEADEYEPESGCREGRRNIVSDPSAGSACKRLNLFLRWVVRKDKIDPGIWKADPAMLLIPLDTHVMKVSRFLGLTERNSADLKTVKEVTGNLKLFDNDDPVRYDFSMSRIGIHPDLSYTELEKELFIRRQR